MKKIIARYAVAIDYFTHKRGVETVTTGRTAMERRPYHAVATERDPVFPATRLARDPSL